MLKGRDTRETQIRPKPKPSRGTEARSPKPETNQAGRGIARHGATRRIVGMKASKGTWSPRRRTHATRSPHPKESPSYGENNNSARLYPPAPTPWHPTPHPN